MNKITFATFAFALLALAGPARAGELLLNGGFETVTSTPGDPAGAQPWFTGTGITGDLVKNWGVPGMTDRSAHLGGAGTAIAGSNGYIAQSFDLTGVYNALLSFDLTTVAHGAPGTAYLDVSLISQTLVDAHFGSVVDGEVRTTHYSVRATGLSGSGSGSIAFFGGSQPGTSTDLYIDNVSLVPQAAPEPASLAALGFGALALLRRRL